MTVKCGFIRTDNNIFDTINFYLAQGMTIDQAIGKAEADLHTQLPQSIKDKIYEVVK